MDAALRPLGYVRNDAEVLKELGWARSEDVGWEDLAKFWGLDPDDRGAMNEATYYTCVKILCETMGKLPLRLMQWESNGGVRTARDHPYYNVLAVRPNPYCTASSFWSRVEYDRINHGNAVVWKQPGAASATRRCSGRCRRASTTSGGTTRGVWPTCRTSTTGGATAAARSC